MAVAIQRETGLGDEGILYQDCNALRVRSADRAYFGTLQQPCTNERRTVTAEANRVRLTKDNRKHTTYNKTGRNKLTKITNTFAWVQIVAFGSLC